MSSQPNKLRSGLVTISDRLKRDAQSRGADYRKHVSSVRIAANPLKLKLTPRKNVRWPLPPDCKEFLETLRRHEFECAGVFEVPLRLREQTVRIRAYANEGRGAMASIVQVGEHFQRTLSSVLQDDSILMLSNTAIEPGAALPNWFDRRTLVGATPADFVAKFFRLRPKSRVRPIRAGDYAALEEDAYFRLQAWLAERGGHSREELQVNFRAAGKLPNGSEGDQLLDMLRLYEIERATWNWLQMQEDLPFDLQEVRESLAIVHDELAATHAANTYWCYSGDYGVREKEFGGGPPTEVFARINTARGGKLQKVLAKKAGLPVDFYLPAD